ncbi:MAG TPA: S8 family peptidase, partial [Candidatus Methanoperedens sp.]|nr:S8 family peptidase [Candidatus Methanoperedens sp.]
MVQRRWKRSEGMTMMLKLAVRSALLGAAAALLMGIETAAARPKSAPPEAWAAAERDREGDIRVVVIQREGSVAERGAERLSRKAVARVHRSFRHIAGDVLRVRPERLAEVIADLEADPEIAAVAPDAKDQRAVGQGIPWGVKRINADPATRGTRSGAGVKLAVVDTGIWRSAAGAIHPDLAAAYRGGYDFVNGDAGPWDDHGHGTHVAGIIAAADNGFGVVGVAPGVSLYAVKVLDATGSGYVSDFIAALDWCIGQGIRIVNYSAGGSVPWGPMEEACDRARAAGITIVAAAGNEGGALIYPAVYASVVSVGSTGPTDQKSWFSNFGDELDLSAPGEQILSSVPGGSYEKWSGTSMATPHVAGAAALLAGRNISEPRLLQEYLQTTALDLGAPGRDPLYGYGRVDAGAALPAEPKVLAPLAGGFVPSGTDTTVSWNPVAGAATYRLLFARGASQAWVPIADSTAATSAPWHPPVVGAALTTG